MHKSRTLFGRPEETGLVAVDRAIAEFRSGRPVLLRNGDTLALATSAELADPVLLEQLDSVAKGAAYLVLSGARLRRLGARNRTEPGVFAMPILLIDRIETLALKIDAKVDAPVAPASAIDEAALELARISLVLPATILVPVTPDTIEGAGLVEVSIADIENYRSGQAASLRIVGRAPVPLEGAPETEFVVFRGGEGLRDQVAIIVGQPDLSGAVPVRLHSACLTG